jgi:hypothetical protein
LGTAEAGYERCLLTESDGGFGREAPVLPMSFHREWSREEGFRSDPKQGWGGEDERGEERRSTNRVRSYLDPILIQVSSSSAGAELKSLVHSKRKEAKEREDRLRRRRETEFLIGWWEMRERETDRVRERQGETETDREIKREQTTEEGQERRKEVSKEGGPDEHTWVILLVHELLPLGQLLLSLCQPNLSLFDLFHELIELICLLIEFMAFRLVMAPAGRWREWERGDIQNVTRIASLLPPLRTIASLLSFQSSRW